MKKRMLLSGLLLTAMVISCSDDDNNNNNAGNNDFKLFTSSNTTGKISVTDLESGTPMTTNFTIPSTDADGIFYNAASDEIYQASRTNNRIDVYENINQAVMNNQSALNIFQSSAADFTNAREIAVSGDKVIVAQDQSDANGLQNKLYVYQRTASGFTLQKTFDVNFKLWGIHYEGTTLYAVVDMTGDLAVFNDFLSNASGMIMPTKRVTIEGLVRTHGITYSASDNTMVLTDVGAAASDTDGGIVVISNFTSVLNNTANAGTIGLASQKRIYGPNSKLGNPVDVAYDNQTNNIYIAERLNAGGQVLVFASPTAATGDATPISSRMEAGVSAVYLLRR